MRRITHKHVSWLHRMNSFARDYKIDEKMKINLKDCVSSVEKKLKAIKKGNNTANS